MRFAAFTTVAASAGEATSSADMLDNLRQQTILAEELVTVFILAALAACCGPAPTLGARRRWYSQRPSRPWK